MPEVFKYVVNIKSALKAEELDEMFDTDAYFVYNGRIYFKTKKNKAMFLIKFS